METILIHDAVTGESTERPMTLAELEQLDADRDAAAAASALEAAAAADREAARESAIARFRGLGFTDAEIAELVLPPGPA